MMALLPVADRAKWKLCQKVNAIQAAVTRDSTEVAFIDLQERFLQADGSINKSLFTDGLHLSAEGYQTWAKGIAAQVDEFMKAPPLKPAKIMLIGGAAIEGVDSANSCRCYLDGMLRRSGHHIDFIGSRHKHNGGKTEIDSYQFDPDHEGHSGKNFAWFAENMPRLLEQNTPHIAVLQPGHDDIAKNITAVITALRAKNPEVKIVLAEPNHTTNRFAKSPVVVVNIGKVLETQVPGADQTRKNAAILAEAISTLLPLKKTSSSH